MDDIVPVNSPVESHTDHSIDSPASHSRDWVNSVQVKSEPLQQRRPKGTYSGTFQCILFMCLSFRL